MRATACFEIINEKGLHARASAQFVQTVEQFDAKVKVSRDNLSVSGDSIMGLLLLAACKGSTIQVEAEGEEAEPAIAAIGALIGARFNEAR